MLGAKGKTPFKKMQATAEKEQRRRIVRHAPIRSRGSLPEPGNGEKMIGFWELPQGWSIPSVVVFERIDLTAKSAEEDGGDLTDVVEKDDPSLVQSPREAPESAELAQAT